MKTEDGQYLSSDDPGEVNIMQDYGLPTSFSGGLAVRKGEKASFWCDLCLVELNSEETMLAHKNGQKHLKKLNAFEQQQLDAGKVVDPNTYIRPTAPQKLAPKKIPIRLKAKLSETQKPVVGLDYITEVISYSNIEMEPHYECRLCHNQGEANGMFNHLLGRGHREKYFESRHDVDLTKITPSELQSRADKWRENDKIDSSIDTIYSDEMYPWPSGKAPWSLEQGGTGNPPTYARDFRRAKNANSLIIKPDPDRRAAETDAPKAIFHVKGLPMLHDAKALEAMYDAMKNLLDQASSFHERHVEDETARVSR